MAPAATTGASRLLRLALRRDRVLLPAWLTGIVALAAVIAGSVIGLYGTEQERVAAARFSAANVVTRVFDGPAAGTELGALVLMEGYWLLAVLIGLCCAQAVVRHTRLDEENGRAELVGAAVVGRLARLVAALAAGGLTALLAGGGVLGVLLAGGLPVSGSVLAAATLAANGLVFVAVAAVAAQVAASARAANAATAGVIGMAFLLRAVGDAAGRVDEAGATVVSAWPSWLSPIGWGQQARAFGDERWWVLWPFAGTVIVLLAVAVFTVTRRDLGAGLVPARPGAARAGRWLTSPVGLVWRLQRGVFVGWALAMMVVGAAFGAVGDSADELVGISEDLALAMEGLADGSLVELYFAFAVGFLAIAASGFGVQAALRLRTEEFGGRTEVVLATAVSRRSWLGAYVTIAAVGTMLLLVLLGASGALAYGALTGAWRTGVDGMLGAAVAHVPAALVLVGVAVIAAALAPRAAVVIGWSALLLSLVLGQVGALLDLPEVVLDVSPFTHVPAVPAEAWSWPPLVALLAVAVVLTVIALLGWRRRDLVLAS